MPRRHGRRCRCSSRRPATPSQGSRPPCRSVRRAIPSTSQGRFPAERSWMRLARIPLDAAVPLGDGEMPGEPASDAGAVGVRRRGRRDRHERKVAERGRPARTRPGASRRAASDRTARRRTRSRGRWRARQRPRRRRGSRRGGTGPRPGRSGTVMTSRCRARSPPRERPAGCLSGATWRGVRASARRPTAQGDEDRQEGRRRAARGVSRERGRVRQDSALGALCALDTADARRVRRAQHDRAGHVARGRPNPTVAAHRRERERRRGNALASR